MKHSIESLAHACLPYDDASEALADETSTVEDAVDLGSADALILRDAAGSAHLMILSSAGKAVKLPVAFFDRYR